MPNPTDSLDDAIHRTCHSYPGSIKALARDLSLVPGTLYNKCNPAMTSHCLNLREALDIMRLSRNFSILEVLCRRTHHACISKVTFRHASDMVLFDAWTACDMEHGKTVEMLREALQDRRIDREEFRQIRAEMFIDFARELELLDRLGQYAGISQAAPAVDDADLAGAVAETVQQYPGGIVELAGKTGMRAIELQKKADASRPDDLLNIHEALRLMLATGHYAILHTLAGLLDHTCVDIPRYTGMNDMELLDAWSSWSDQRGDTVCTIHDALRDSTVECEELTRIEQEMFRDFETELALLARLGLMVQ